MKWGAINADGMKTYPLHAGQAAVLRSQARYTAALAGTGGGKTVTGPLWKILRLRDHFARADASPYLGMILAPTYQILSRATMPTFIDTLKGTELEGRWLESKHQYQLPSGMGLLWTLSSDDPNGIEGGQYDDIWYDEAGQGSYGAWVAIQGRLGMKRGRALFTTTPYRLNWMKKEIVRRFKKGDPDYNVVSWSNITNPMYPREEYERAKKTMAPALFGMRYDGVFPEDDALVFPAFDYDKNVRDCEYSPARPVYVACNFQMNPMYFALAHQTLKGDVEVFDEMIMRDTTTARALDALRSRLVGAGPVRFFGDAPGRGNTAAAASDYQTILADARFPRRTISALANPAAVVDRVAATNARFIDIQGHPRIFIAERCKGLIQDLESRFLEDKYRAPKAPEETEDAGPFSDALTFMMHFLYPIRPGITTGSPVGTSANRKGVPCH